MSSMLEISKGFFKNAGSKISVQTVSEGDFSPSLNENENNFLLFFSYIFSIIKAKIMMAESIVK